VATCHSFSLSPQQRLVPAPHTSEALADRYLSKLLIVLCFVLVLIGRMGGSSNCFLDAVPDLNLDEPFSFLSH
jgi:hypothetical protein